MDYKPGDLFISVIDFFAVILPGALFSFLFLDYRYYIFGPVFPEVGEGAPSWVAFIFASYMFGHFIFAVGSLFLDPFYDRFYAKAQRVKKDELPTAGRFLRLRKWLRRYYLSVRNVKEKFEDDALKARADKYKKEDFDKENKENAEDRIDTEITNLFWWAGSIVRLQNANAAAEIDRLLADSKFFRSVTVVLLLISCRLLVNSAYIGLSFCILLLLLSMWRFMELRWKGTERTYEYYIALKKMSKPTAEGKGETE